MTDWSQELLDLVRDQQNDDAFGRVISPERLSIPLWNIEAIVDEEGATTLRPKGYFLSGRKVKRLRKRGTIPHGDRIRYASGCRCEACRLAASAHGHANRRDKGIPPKLPPRHGTISGYQKLRCRCRACGDAWNAYMRDYRLARKTYLDV